VKCPICGSPGEAAYLSVGVCEICYADGMGRGREDDFDTLICASYERDNDETD
jgi:hypothetical protein